MNSLGKSGLAIVLMAGIAFGVAFNVWMSQPAQAQAGAGGSYSVVMTDGTHLIVTDNKANMLYFYSIEKDAAIGSPLKLRGSADLTQVGKESIAPKTYFKKEKD